jgi:DNA replication protein DnaC
VYFVVVPDLLDHLRSAYAPDSPLAYDVLFDKIRNAPFLIMDDLGAHTTSPWAQEKLFQLLNYRYNGRLPTVITTSLDRPQFAEMSPALASRIGHPQVSNVIAIDAPDFRMGEEPRDPSKRPPEGPGRAAYRRPRRKLR